MDKFSFWKRRGHVWPLKYIALIEVYIIMCVYVYMCVSIDPKVMSSCFSYALYYKYDISKMDKLNCISI